MTDKKYENKPNTGALFKNKKKEAGDKRPDYTGTLYLGNTEMWLSAWVKVSQSGEKYMSVAIQPKERRDADPMDRVPDKKIDRDEMEDEIPHLGGSVKAPF